MYDRTCFFLQSRESVICHAAEISLKEKTTKNGEKQEENDSEPRGVDDVGHFRHRAATDRRP